MTGLVAVLLAGGQTAAVGPMAFGSVLSEPAQLFLPWLGQLLVATQPTATSTSSLGTASPTLASTRLPPATATPTAPASVTPTAVRPGADDIVAYGSLRSGSVSVTYDPTFRTYRLTYRGEVTIRYEIETTHPDNALGRLAIREARSGRYPVAGAGLYYCSRDGRLVEPRFLGELSRVDRVEYEALPSSVTINVYETIEGARHAKQYVIGLVGRSLRIQAISLDPLAGPTGCYCGFSAGEIEGTTDAVTIRVPYMDAVPITMLDHRWFASTLVSYPRSEAGALMPRGPAASHGSVIDEVATLYPADASGRVRPVNETVWVTLSPEIEDVFAVPQQRRANLRPLLASSLHLVLLGGDGVTFADEAAYVAQLAGWGVRDLVIHKRGWREPTSLWPRQGPPREAAGGEQGLRQLLGAAPGPLSVTGAFTLTEAPCPGEVNALYVPSDRVTDSNGEPVRLTDEAGRRPCGGDVWVGRYLLAPDAAVRIAGLQLPGLAVMGIRGMTLGAEAAGNPGYPFPGAEASVIDRGATSDHPATLREAILAYKELLTLIGSRHGRVFGFGATGAWEWGYDSFYAGYLDAISRSLSPGSLMTPGCDYLVVPDYELAAIAPLAVGFGMGDYRQFFGPFVDSSAGRPRPLSSEQIDEYRATALAYGHAGAWFTTTAPLSSPDRYLTPAQELKEYYLMRALQTRYLGVRVQSIRYVTDDGLELSLSQAFFRDEDLVHPRLRIRYTNGLEFWINHSRSVWTVLVGDTVYDLPSHGWLAVDWTRNEIVGLSALIDGQRIDYARGADYVLLDGRGYDVEFGGRQTRDLKIWLADGRTLAARSDGSVTFLP